MQRIAVIGAGNIGEALIAGLIRSGVEGEAVTATNRSSERSRELEERYGVRTTSDNAQAVRDADVAFLCVKPAQVLDVIGKLGDAVAGGETVLVSMAAGVSIAAMQGAVSVAGTPVVRVMPNTPMLQGKGVLAVAYSRFVDGAQREAVADLLSAVGEVVDITEDQMDAATAVSGSGPAYFFLVAEALTDAGVSLGLPRDLAERLAVSTAEGAGAMLAHDGRTPAELRAGVSSPAGTTVRAIRELEESGLRGAFYRATEACARRSAELGE